MPLKRQIVAISSVTCYRNFVYGRDGGRVAEILRLFGQFAFTPTSRVAGPCRAPAGHTRPVV